MKRMLLFVFLAMSAGAFAGKIEKKVTVNFETNKDELDARQKEKLTQLVKEIDLTRDYRIQLSGHTDSRGSFSYNDELSRNRAEEVRDFLIQQGICPNCVEFTFHGERKPMVGNTSDHRMSKNRRVEVVFTSYYFESKEDLLDSLSVEYTEDFWIDPRVSNSISTRHGLNLYIEAGSFVNGDEHELSKVQVTIKEGNGLESFIAHDLMTLSGNEMIESDGMFYLEAKNENGEELSLNSEKPIRVELPTENKRSDMELFVSDDGQQWTSTGPIEEKEKKNQYGVKRPRLAKIPPFKYKKYAVDKSAMPVPPAKPKMPRNPHQPRMESYQPPNNLYTWIFKKKAQEKANERYLEAVDKFMEKESKYEVQLANYKYREERYKDRFEKYKEDYNAWLQEERRKADQDYKAQRDVYNDEYALQIRMNKKLKAEYLQALKEMREAQLDGIAQQMDSLSTADLNEGSAYTMRVMRMGWINCDRFLDVTNEKILAVWDNDDSEEMVRLILPDQNGMMGLNYLDGAYRLTSRIPDNERLIAFALKVEGGSPYVYAKEVKDHEENLEMNFVKTRFSDLKGLISDMKKRNTAMLDRN